MHIKSLPLPPQRLSPTPICFDTTERTTTPPTTHNIIGDTITHTRTFTMSDTAREPLLFSGTNKIKGTAFPARRFIPTTAPRNRDFSSLTS
jgi:hypothetical protein